MDVAESVPFVTVEWVLDGSSAVINDYSDSVVSAFEKVLEENNINSLLVLKGRDYQYNAMEKMKGFNRIINKKNWVFEREVFSRNSDFDAISGYEVVKVIGFGDMVDKVTSYFPVTTIVQKLEDIGRESIVAIKEILEGKEKRSHIVHTEFIAGRT